ncbi:hypothetical protein QJS04_geneDACA016059 [Acorus gramineus]|uniref:33 kDa subunit of oxygen evolving system of photosystem II n=1 Tax=Acorus gramineus TaxID=55184 RepID=A0AAV9BHB5_ACOGR|nr:hypothetical protein QJS04_geneDACA016059 [Acorus gramineus]
MASSSLQAVATLLQPAKRGSSRNQSRLHATQTLKVLPRHASPAPSMTSHRVRARGFHRELERRRAEAADVRRDPVEDVHGSEGDWHGQPVPDHRRRSTRSRLIKAGKYNLKKLCLEPTSFTVKVEGVAKNAPAEFQKTKLMTRLTYTLNEIEGPFEVAGDGDGDVRFVKYIRYYAAVTVQLPGGERVPFLFTVKQLVAAGKPEAFKGSFLVPSYRGSSFLDPQGRGGSTGYDNAMALPARGRGDEEELTKDNVKNTASSKGTITLSVTGSKPDTGEVIGVFESLQPSDTDLGAKVPKDVKIQGIWYGQLES